MVGYVIASVCWFVCQLDYSELYGLIFMKLWEGTLLKTHCSLCIEASSALEVLRKCAIQILTYAFGQEAVDLYVCAMLSRVNCGY